MSAAVAIFTVAFKYIIPIILTAAFVQLETEGGGASITFVTIYEAVLFAAGIITYKGMARGSDGTK